ncbi:SigB/SigF/SigG family RNA polymerase sigma factor [Patulibacter sp. SYSU D01012]|uniref:SigB/SigF/SigG family RNA polymerase sigma factor n=1 Tax=Patulibacter sp. SYSU D01012 TaxID=2817381 RepID=UPI001B30FCB4|nr:SigB/SigF/SigG family RNA polymerase sigma factor [Patulibacter sp. SYSU D01012]
MLEDATRRDQIDLQLLRRYHVHQDLEAREEMVRRGLPLVRALARQYAGRGDALEDLVQVGTIGLIKAIDRFDPEAGSRFAAFASPNITGEIKRHFRDHCWAIHVPRSVQELDAKISRESDRMSAKTGRAPTAAELAERLSVPASQVADALVGGRGYRTLSLDHPVGETGEALDRFGREEPGYGLVERKSLVEDACRVLDEREREVVELRFVEGMLQREIAERIGVSQMQVSRILARALDRMRTYLEMRGAPGDGALLEAEAA